MITPVPHFRKHCSITTEVVFFQIKNQSCPENLECIVLYPGHSLISPQILTLFINTRAKHQGYEN